MRPSLIVVLLIPWIQWSSAGVATAGIRLENESQTTLRVFLKGVNDKEFRGPYPVPPRCTVEINVAPGRYWVATQHPDKTFDYLNWQDYSDHKITYRVSLCVACGYMRPGGQKAPPPQVFKASVHYADEYKCPTCGRMHRRWMPGWKSGDVRDGLVNGEGEMLSENVFDFRLGVSVIEANNGVMVTQSLDDSPSRKLRSVAGDRSKTHYLVAGKAIISHVNGKPTPDTAEFVKLLSESPHRVELTVTSLGGKITANYWTDLSQ